MLKYTVTYTDFEGNKHEKDLWFHISKTNIIMSNDEVYTDILSMGQQLQASADLVDKAQKAIEEKQASGDAKTDDLTVGPNELVVAKAVRLMGQLLDKIIGLSYGERTSDGQGFSKNQNVLDKFKESLAYEALIDSLLSDPEKLISFVTRLIPEK